MKRSDRFGTTFFYVWALVDVETTVFVEREDALSNGPLGKPVPNHRAREKNMTIKNSPKLVEDEDKDL